MRGWLTAIVAALTLLSPADVRADEKIVIEATGIVPPVLRTTTGHRVTFVNRSQRAAHLEFARDGGEHQLFQVPVGGPIWAVFHSPGKHPYVIHVFGSETLRGAVEVVEDTPQKSGPPVCAVNVMGVCIEP